MADPTSDLAEKLRFGGWRGVMHADGSGFALWAYVSVADPRVTLLKRLTRRSGLITSTWSFGDPAVDVPVAPGGPIVEAADARTFDNLDDLAVCILAHDKALAADRAWEAAAPP